MFFLWLLGSVAFENPSDLFLVVIIVFIEFFCFKYVYVF